MSYHLVIFGVGLIGGSFALALRQAGVVASVVGVGRSETSLARACELGIVDRYAIADSDVAAAVGAADLILLAAPVAQTGAILRQIAPHLPPHAVITDAGSTKSDVVAAARAALGARIAQFVPGHPIAGSEAHGPDAAKADLYAGKKVVLTPLAENAPATVQLVADVWGQCGARLHRLAAQQHDQIFAAVSHLPHLLAFALVDEFAARPEAVQLFDYAASGFRDFTRIAASSPEMWRDISLANQPALLAELDAYMAQLTRLRGMLASSDGAALETVFAAAQAARHDWQDGKPFSRYDGQT